jgi:hypothetical protein
VGGITIYEKFELLLHPIRLQLDTTMGGRLLEYVWPNRRNRKQKAESGSPESPTGRMRRAPEGAFSSRTRVAGRISLDSPRATENGTKSLEADRLAPPTLRRIGTSRSFTDLRTASREQSPPPPLRQRTTSFGANLSLGSMSQQQEGGVASSSERKNKEFGDAEEMKSRSSQKSFVLVRVGRYSSSCDQSKNSSDYS